VLLEQDLFVEDRTSQAEVVNELPDQLVRR